jgi:hypothetical protein
LANPYKASEFSTRMPRGVVGRPSGKQIEQHGIVRLVPEIDMATPSP